MCPDADTETPCHTESCRNQGLHYSFNTVTGIKGMSNLEAKKVLEEIRKGLTHILMIIGGRMMMITDI